MTHPADPNAPVPPGIAVLANVLTPYRIHLHRRIAAGIPEFKLHSLFTHAEIGFRWDTALPPEINVVNFGAPGESTWRPWHDWRKGGRVVRYLHDHNVRACICHGYYYATNVRALTHCHRHGVRTFFRSDSNIRQDNPGGPLRRLLKGAMVRWVFRRCDAFLPVGSLCQQFYERYGAEAERCFPVPFEPDYDYFAAAPQPDLADFRRRHQLHDCRRWLLYSGRLAALKRVDLLLESFGRIAAVRPDWGLLIAGDGPLSQGLRNSVPQPLRPRIRWTGFLETDQVRSAYHAGDVLVLPSDKEPWALVVNEAMAAGLPIVCSDMVGAAADLIADAVNGRTFPAGDLDKLTAALLDVTDDKNHSRYRAAVAPALARWRTAADPVIGLRRALAFVGLLPNASPARVLPPSRN